MLFVFPSSLGGFSAHIESTLQKRDGKALRNERDCLEGEARFMYLLEAFFGIKETRSFQERKCS